MKDLPVIAAKLVLLLNKVTIQVGNSATSSKKYIALTKLLKHRNMALFILFQAANTETEVSSAETLRHLIVT